MSYEAKRQLLLQVADRYKQAGHAQKSIILDEFVAATGYERKYAIRLLRSPVIPPPAPIKRPRERRYGREVGDALAVAWEAANRICSKSLVPFLPELVENLERNGHLTLTDEVRAQLLALSPATADRLLRPMRERDRPRGISTTRPGAPLERQIPIRTFADWDDARPGFFEADLVAHCGGSAEGAFLCTLTLTDIATGWTECLPLLHRTQQAVIQALDKARKLIPFPVLGLDTDNGREFINEMLVEYCEREGITFTRGRVARKNDQCFVEQKNGSVVRQIVGYDRFVGERPYRQLVELYRAVRLYGNFFRPSVKLKTKTRDGSRVKRTYDIAATPYRRLLASGVLGAEESERLEAIYRGLDPVLLLRQIGILQEALWRHAVLGGTPTTLTDSAAMQDTSTVRFDPGADVPPDGTASEGNIRRKYHRSEKPRVERYWRTREDPFEGVWGEIVALLELSPERTAKSVFGELQGRYPGRFPDAQLRTLQRRVKEWRERALVEFDDGWLQRELLAGDVPPPRLRGRTEPQQASVPGLVVRSTHPRVVSAAQPML
jgi:hypothetical protein